MQKILRAISKKGKHCREYMLCFHDFSERKRYADIFIHLTSSCNDTIEDIFRHFNKKGNATQFVRQLFHIYDGHWRVIHIEDIARIPTVDYSELTKNDKKERFNGKI